MVMPVRGGAVERELTDKGQQLPLAVAQRGLWVGQKIGPPDAVFNLAEYTEIDGPLDVAAFMAALQRVAAEVEAVRSRVVEGAEGPRQCIAAVFSDELAFLDYSEREDAHAQALAWMQAELSRPVDLARDPLWRCALFRIGADRHYWYHRCHHVAIDGYTGGLISRRLAEHYRALVSGSPAPACAFLPLARLIEHEQAYRASARYQRDRKYWLGQLRDLPAPISLSGRRVAERAGGLLRASVQISEADTDALRDLAAGLGGSLPQLLIALLATYIYRLTEADDLVFGMPVSARASRELRRIPGMLANAVAIRLRMDPHLTLAELVPQVAGQVRNALRHQQYRYEELRRDLGLLAQDQQISWVGINIEPFDYQLDFGTARARTHNLSNGTVEDLTFFVYDRDDGHGLRVDLDANRALYDPGELDGHARRLSAMIHALLADPTRSLGALTLLANEETAALARWNATARDWPAGPWYRRFEALARQRPEAIAVEACDGRLSYAELDAAAERCAHALLAAGVRPGDLVALALPRELGLVVALLAVHKAGAAYLPLSRSTPLQRLAYTLVDAAPRVLLTNSEVAAGLPADIGPRRLLLDRLGDAEQPGAVIPQPQPQPESPAYVIYTSGSTGRPKGVVVPHRALHNFLHAMQAVIGVVPEDRLLAVTTLAFDIAALEIYLPLTVGARVVLASRAQARDPALLCGLIEARGISLMQATPSHWQTLVQACPQALAGLCVLTGGEALAPGLARRLHAAARRLINLYGPTETTVWSTAVELDSRDLDAPPIGRPIANTQAHVLDRQLRPLPIGVAGDLYLAGQGVAQGYLGRPDLSAERFRRNPFDDAAPGLLYATGDRVRWRADGQLEYLGRSDCQIKIHGYRVEAGEIEAVLCSQTGVDQALVTLGERPGGGAVLIAYLVGRALPEPEALRRALIPHLPAYMIPGLFVPLPGFPLTANGKVDRQALPAPRWSTAGGGDAGAAPRDPLEAELLELWREVLGVEEIGIHDSFFDLGGDSLSAARMLLQLRARSGRELPLAAIFDATTIAGLAARLAQRDAIDPLAPVLRLRAEGQGPALFCIHPVVGLAWGYSSLLRHLDPTRPVYGLQAPGLREGALPQSLEALAEQQLALIRDLQPQGPYHLLGWSMGGLLAHCIAERLEQAGETVAGLTLLDAYPYVQDQAPADQVTQVRLALNFLGFEDPDLAGELGSMEALCDFLCRAYQVDRHPLLADLGEARVAVIARLRGVIANHLALLRRYRPGKVRARARFLRAARGSDPGLHGAVLHAAGDWAGHLGGLEIHDIDCRHQEMMDPEPAAAVAAWLRG